MFHKHCKLSNTVYNKHTYRNSTIFIWLKTTWSTTKTHRCFTIHSYSHYISSHFCHCHNPPKNCVMHVCCSIVDLLISTLLHSDVYRFSVFLVRCPPCFPTSRSSVVIRAVRASVLDGFVRGRSDSSSSSSSLSSSFSLLLAAMMLSTMSFSVEVSAVSRFSSTWA